MVLDTRILEYIYLQMILGFLFFFFGENKNAVYKYVYCISFHTDPIHNKPEAPYTLYTY